jgi:hypothetical protein
MMKPNLEHLIEGDKWRAIEDDSMTFTVLRVTTNHAVISWGNGVQSEIKPHTTSWTFDYENITPETVIAKRILEFYE